MRLFPLRKIYDIGMRSDPHTASEIASPAVGLTAPEMSALLDAKELEIFRLRRQVAWFQRRIFGQKSERRMPEPEGVQGTLGEAFDIVPDDMACLYLDIDKFKDVNDLLGHAGGDCALIEFGKRLRHCVRESDLVARLAGDEFVIALEAVDDPSEAEGVAAKIIASMEMPFDIEGTQRVVTTSIGIVVADPMLDDARSLLRSADETLYRAMRAGRNRGGDACQRAWWWADTALTCGRDLIGVAGAIVY